MPVQETSPQDLTGVWTAENGVKITLNENGLDNIIINEDVFFQNGRKIVYNESIWGYYGFKENSTTTFNDNGFQAKLKRENWEYDLLYFQSGNLEGNLLPNDIFTIFCPQKRMKVTFSSQEGYMFDRNPFWEPITFTRQN